VDIADDQQHGGTNKADQSKKALHANAAEYSNDCYGGGQAEHGHRIACTNGLHDLAPQLGSERASQSDGCPPKDGQNPCAHVRLCFQADPIVRPAYVASWPNGDQDFQDQP
jgi:hypothetical protein